MAVIDQQIEAIDLADPAYLEDPYPTYRLIRDAGSAVYLPKHDAYAVGRYDDLRTMLSDWERFTSTGGIALNPPANEATRGLIISVDPPFHDQLRKILSERLSPKAMRQLTESIRQQARDLALPVLQRGSFDAVTDLAQAFPIQVVLDLVGIPHDARGKVLGWADAAFTASGPMSQAVLEAFPLLQDQFAYLASLHRDDLTEGSFGRTIYDAAGNGDIPHESVVPLMSAYVTAGLDTTINLISNAVQLFAEQPQQWTWLRGHREFLPQAINELLRYESPLQYFCRTAKEETRIGDTTVPAGARLIAFYPSGNRDERRWGDTADAVDLSRSDAGEHIAFGYGVHSCAGQALARLEGKAMLEVLLDTVESFEIGTPVRRHNLLVRGLASLPTTVTLA